MRVGAGQGDVGAAKRAGQFSKRWFRSVSYVDHDCIAALRQYLESDPRVVFSLWVAGRYDLLIEIVSNDKDALQDFLEREIHAQADIADADVMLGLKNFKNQFLLKRDL
ncbi:Lrp/AsnC ligand binding domain-containing protein [Aliiroseovarius sp. YM-037]|uniref:Lrp/AsnC ligand binding domain-containing protein n=1 Tax=Aliiroseovarius sp. YM-037 TaxID=3341728 RepID=UPI003A802673